jgi:hypothetical protein
MDGLKSSYDQLCEYFDIAGSDDKAKQTQAFFKLFLSFFDRVKVCIPEEKKKPAATRATQVKKASASKGKGRKTATGSAKKGGGGVSAALNKLKEMDYQK